MPISMQPQTSRVSTSSSPGEPRPDGSLPGRQQPVVVRGGEDLVVAVPYLIGFPPERSLVVVSLRRDGARSVLGVLARYDLPPATCPRTPRDDAATAATQQVAQAVALLGRDDAEQVVALVYDTGPCSETPPWRDLVDGLEEALRARDVVLMDALFVAGSRFRSYRCTDPGCCPSRGRLFDASTGRVAAELRARGGRRMASRAELRATVRATDPGRCADVEATARRELTGIGRHWAEEHTSRWRAWQLRSLRLLDTVARRYASGDSRIASDEAGRIIAGLADVAVRDAAAVLHTGWAHPSGDDPGRADGVGPGAAVPTPVAESAGVAAHPAGGHGSPGARVRQLVDAVRADDEPTDELCGDQHDRRLEAMWVDVVCCCDGPLAAAPLTLLGLHAWSRGNGVLAAAAADRALEVAPDYRLALLLDRVLGLGLRPERPGGGPPRRGERPSEGSGPRTAPSA